MTMVETVVYPETKVIQLSTKTLIEQDKQMQISYSYDDQGLSHFSRTNWNSLHAG